MKIIQTDIVISSSMNDDNTWYIFRTNGVEVKIEIVNKQIKADKSLTEIEIEYIKNNLL